MNDGESAKIRRNLRRAVVQTSTAAVAVLVTAILLDHARGGELMDCEPQRVSGDGRHWAHRVIEGRECWYPGERGKPKNELRWNEGPSAPQQSRVLEQSGVEGGPPEPATQRFGVVEQSKVSHQPGRSLCARRAQGATKRPGQPPPNQAGPHRRRFSASCPSRSSTGTAIAGFLSQLSQGWRQMRFDQR